MARALELGRQVRRLTAPNPWVGCVVVRDGAVVGEGATAPPGGRHAEAVALAAAGARAVGATLYTTLEPCPHTRPDRSVRRRRRRRRHRARRERDRRSRTRSVSGRGHAALRAAGSRSMSASAPTKLRHLLAPYLVHRREGRSFVVLKTATSLDGRVAAADGASRWITGEAARADAPRTPRRCAGRRRSVRAPRSPTTLRSRSAASAVPLGPPPLRVLLDGSRSRSRDRPALRPDARARHSSSPPTTRRPWCAKTWEAAGAEVEVVGDAARAAAASISRASSRCSPGAACSQALVEGGPTLHGAFLDARPRRSDRRLRRADGPRRGWPRRIRPRSRTGAHRRAPVPPHAGLEPAATTCASSTSRSRPPAPALMSRDRRLRVRVTVRRRGQNRHCDDLDAAPPDDPRDPGRGALRRPARAARAPRCDGPHPHRVRRLHRGTSTNRCPDGTEHVAFVRGDLVDR